MNKKLLGIAAVALLGVSAAFAATTSTVYFTASGTLTKVVSPLSGVTETSDDPSSGSRPHTDEKGVGVSYVYTSYTDATYPCKGRYQGEDISTDSTDTLIGVKYSTVGRVANPSTSVSEYTVTTPPYVYKEIYLSNLKFSKASDYYMIPFCVVNFDSNTQYLNGFYPYKGDGDSTVFQTDPETITFDETYKVYYQFQWSNTYLDPVSNPTKDTESLLAGQYSIGVSSSNSKMLYLAIYVDANYTLTTETFSGVSIKLPDFTDTASGTVQGK